MLPIRESTRMMVAVRLLLPETVAAMENSSAQL